MNPKFFLWNAIACRKLTFFDNYAYNTAVISLGLCIKERPKPLEAV